MKLCRDLGAEVISADQDAAFSLPIDMSLGEGEPILPVAEDRELRDALSRYVVPAVSDARTVVERNLSSERLVENSTRDPLTGLWSRRAMTLGINRCKPGDCIAMVDLDFFKSVNDTLGHDAGDAVLSAFGSHLSAGTRDGDIVGRLGGEEFVILFPRTPLDEACAVMERLRSAWHDISPQGITFSAGVTLVREHAEPGTRAPQEALKEADALMYRAKALGRNRVLCAGGPDETDDRPDPTNTEET